jgi:hypothetical protein
MWNCIDGGLGQLLTGASHEVKHDVGLPGLAGGTSLRKRVEVVPMISLVTAAVIILYCIATMAVSYCRLRSIV